MSVSIQNFRSEVAGESPDFLCPGQLAFNLADQVMFLGDGTNQRTDINGNPVLPNPPEGKGWRAYQLGGSGGGVVTSVTGSGAITAAPTVGDVILSALTASTSQAGVVQLTDSTSTTSSTTALTATGAKSLQDQINSLAVSSNLTFAGTISGATGFMATVTTAGTAAGFTVGSAMPTSASGNAEFFAIVTTAGTMTPPGGSATEVQPADWWLSTGTGYQLIDAGQSGSPVPATPTVAGVVLGCTTSGGLTSVGQNALSANTTGNNNVAIGINAGNQITTGSQNVAIGPNVQLASATASGQLAIGYSATNNWLTGDAGRNIKPGAGIIDCANSIGANGQVLMSNGANRVCWGTAASPLTGVAPITVTTGSSPVVSVGSSSITALGVVQLYNDVNSTSTTLALTAAQGKVLQDQINSLATTSNLTFAGTFDASASQLLTVSSQGASQGFVVGNNIPAPAAANTDYFVIVTTGGSYSPPGGGGPFTTSQGDWLLSSGSSWQFLNVGPDFTVPAATPIVEGVVYGCSAIDNTALGSLTFNSITTGVNNAALGTGTLFNLIGGNSNVAIGAYAICNITSGNNNTAIGTIAGTNITTGSQNVAIGTDVTVASATGSCQLAIGFAAGENWLTGTSSKAIQPGAGIIDCANSCGTAGQALISTGSNSVCWGDVAVNPSPATSINEGVVYGCTTATSTALGYAPLLSDAGTNNIVIGHAIAAAPIGTTSNSVIIGSGECIRFANVANQFVIGDGCGGYLIRGWPGGSLLSRFVQFGGGIIDSSNCGPSCGSILVGNGPSSQIWINYANPYFSASCNKQGTVFGSTPTSTFNTTSYGVCAGLNSCVGEANTYLGEKAGYTSSPQSGLCNNTAIGTWTLYNIQSNAINNTALGYRAGGGGSSPGPSGNCNTALGSSSGINLTAGSSNTLVGYGAGSQLSTGSGNIYIGAGAGATGGQGSFNVAIGCGVFFPDLNQSCQLAIGFATGQNWLTGDSSKNIQPGAGIKDCSGNVGTVNQVLCSNGTRLQWANVGALPPGRVVSGIVDSGVAICMDNFAFSFAASGCRSFGFNTLSGTACVTWANWGIMNGAYKTASVPQNFTITTALQRFDSSYNFLAHGNTQCTIICVGSPPTAAYQVLGIVGPGYANNIICVTRIV